MKSRSFLIAIAALFSIIAADSLRAQVASTGSITGTVTDASGAAVGGATVTVTNQATQVVRTTTTTAAGFYSVEALLAGSYTINITKTGFQAAITKDFALAPGQRLEHSVALTVGNVETQVTVEAAAVQVQTESGESGGVVTSKEVDNLMLNGRNFQGLGLLIPGVNSTAGAGSQPGGGLTGGTSLVINGLGIEYSTYTIDGTYNMNTGNMTNINILPSVDVISEFRIAKNAYSAKYGMAGAGQVMIETKSGTNDYHGTAWEFLRNDAFDARNFFATNKNPLHQNIFGFVLGGPLIIPKLYNGRTHRTFFLASEEWRVNHVGQTLRGSMIPAAMRGGDFSNSPTLGKGGLQLSANSVNLLAKEGKTNCVLSATQLNPNCFDSNAVAIMNRYWPLPNNPGGGFLNYINPISVEATDQQDDTYRVDQYLGDKWVLMGRFMYEQVNDQPPALTWGPNPAPTTLQKIYTSGLNALVRLTTTIKPTVVNTFSAVETFDKPRLEPINAKLPSDIKINQAFANADQYNRIPTVNISQGWAGIGTSSLPVDASDGEGTISDDISIVKGAHVIQAGGLYIFGIKRQNLFANTYGVFNFSGVRANDPVADFLLGLDSSYNQVNVERRGYFRYKQFEPYVQDDWKVNRRLTVNIGLRYQYFSSDTMEGNGVTNFFPNTFNPAKAPQVLPNGNLVTNAAGQPLTPSGALADPLNGIVFAGKNGVPRGFFNGRKLNFAPRIGFAWDPFGDGRSSVRGGFGMGYSRTPFDIYGGLTNPPYTLASNVINGTLTNPLLGAPGAVTAQGLSLVAGDFQPTRIESWNFTVERELFKNAIFNIGYVGSAAHHIKGNRDINFPVPVSTPALAGCLQPGQTIPSTGFDFDPCLNTGAISANYERPYQGYSGLGLPFTGGDSNYHSLQTAFNYRTGPVTVTGAYTYGKTLSDVVSRGTGASSNTGSGAQNPRDFSLEYGPAGFSRTHIFTASWVYDLPFFRTSRGLVGQALGHWSLSGIAVLESGFALNPGLSTSTNGLASRPNVVGKLTYPKKVDEWFNTSAFAAPAFGFFGNAGPGSIRGPSEKSFNIALFKAFPITERAKLQFRAEAFNVANHTNFSSVQTGVGAPNYGQITGAREPRILEFALKFIF